MSSVKCILAKRKGGQRRNVKGLMYNKKHNFPPATSASILDLYLDENKLHIHNVDDSPIPISPAHHCGEKSFQPTRREAKLKC